MTLTPLQTLILTRLAEGDRYKEIADRVKLLTAYAIEQQVARMKVEYGCRSTVQLVAKAVREGVI